MKFLLPATLALAAVASTNAADFCTFNNDDSSKAVAGAYTVYNNVGESNVNAQQCTGVDSSEGTSIAWHTSYNTTGDDALSKSFVVASLQMNQTKLAELQSIPTEVTYTYTSQGEMISNAVYDMYTTSYGHPQYKVMVWLASYGGAKLKSTTGLPIKTATVGGVEFDLYQGYYQNMGVYTFVAKTPLTTFKGDLKPFFSEIPADFTEQALQAVYFGTEAFKGTNAKFSVSKLSVSLQ
ncbi:hypothetical protein DVH05_007422 [Phytophthora capsici]|nr:hypothetical protein DVH05_007422 [Phytophthora capsici]UPT50361.1 glycoside hydrolase family 12 (GH12) protein [Phytophthora capsici]|eukprot:jgi/Phyca11/7335/fgenesh1_pm.PHYCAscaffold_18_\